MWRSFTFIHSFILIHYFSFITFFLSFPLIWCFFRILFLVLVFYFRVHLCIAIFYIIANKQNMFATMSFDSLHAQKIYTCRHVDMYLYTNSCVCSFSVFLFLTCWIHWWSLRSTLSANKILFCIAKLQQSMAAFVPVRLLIDQFVAE